MIEDYQKHAHDLSRLVRFHRDEVIPFADEVRVYCENQYKKPGKGVDPEKWKGIRVRSFLMDLIGRVREFDDSGDLQDPQIACDSLPNIVEFPVQRRTAPLCMRH